MSTAEPGETCSARDARNETDTANAQRDDHRAETDLVADTTHNVLVTVRTLDRLGQLGLDLGQSDRRLCSDCLILGY